jgi:hypothetical protein
MRRVAKRAKKSDPPHVSAASNPNKIPIAIASHEPGKTPRHNRQKRFCVPHFGFVGLSWHARRRSLHIDK